MKKPQLVVAFAGIVLVLAIFLFGKTTNKSSNKLNNQAKEQAHEDHKNGDDHELEFKNLLVELKKSLTAEQNQRLLSLENAVVRGDVKEQQLHVYHQLAQFWRDTARVFIPYAYYNAQAAKLENSEKSLTFAAQLLVDNLLEETDPSVQHWLATNAKDLLDKALIIQPNNDSNKVALGACYIFGNISDQPMQGILPVKEIADKNPNNTFAQFVLALGGKKSGQFDKAIERFTTIVTKNPSDIRAIWHLAECYEMKKDFANAVKWYQMIADKQTNVKVKQALLDRIKELKAQQQ